METFGVSERFACRVLGQHRSTQRKNAKKPDDETALTADIIALATWYGRYGYRRITALLREAGWIVNFKRVERIWRREGLNHISSRREGGCGSMTDRASGCGPSIQTMSGLTTSSKIALTMGGNIAC